MTTGALHADDLESFENFIAKYTKPKLAARRQQPVKAEGVNDLPDTDVPDDGFLLSTVSNVSFHQKVRRAFLSTGYFRFDGSRRDIEIRQIGNVLEIEVNVSAHPKAKDAAIATWRKMRERIVDAEWNTADLDEITYVEERQIVHILFGSDKLLKKITI